MIVDRFPRITPLTRIFLDSLCHCLSYLSRSSNTSSRSVYPVRAPTTDIGPNSFLVFVNIPPYSKSFRRHSSPIPSSLDLTPPTPCEVLQGNEELKNHLKSLTLVSMKRGYGLATPEETVLTQLLALCPAVDSLSLRDVHIFIRQIVLCPSQ